MRPEILSAAGSAGGVYPPRAPPQTPAPVEAPVGAPRAAAGDRHDYIFNSLCVRPSAGPNTGGVDEASPDPSILSCRARQGVRQSLFRRREGIFRLGGDDV